MPDIFDTLAAQASPTPSGDIFDQLAAAHQTPMPSPSPELPITQPSLSERIGGAFTGAHLASPEEYGKGVAPLPDELAAAVADQIRGLPSMAQQIPKQALAAYRLREGTPEEQVQTLAEIIAEAKQGGTEIAQGLQEPVGSRDWWNSAIQMGTMAAPAIGELGSGAITRGAVRPEIPSRAEPPPVPPDVQPPAAPPEQPEIITPELGSPFQQPEIPTEDVPYAGGQEAPIGAANKVSAARAEAGLLGQEGAPPPGIGVGWQDSVTAGNAAIDAGADPYKIVSDFQKNQLINGQRMGVARAWLERLQRANAEARGALEQNPSDPVLAQKAQAAQDAENSYWRGYQPMKTEWHKVGTGMQEMRGITDTDLLSQATAEQAMREHLDRELSDDDKARAAKAVNDTRTANAAVGQAFEKANGFARGAARGPVRSLEALKADLAKTLKEITC